MICRQSMDSQKRLDLVCQSPRLLSPLVAACLFKEALVDKTKTILCWGVKAIFKNRKTVSSFFEILTFWKELPSWSVLPGLRKAAHSEGLRFFTVFPSLK